MARENKTPVPAAIGNQEILAEINLISQIQQIETRLASEPDSPRFAQLADAYLGIGDFDHAIALCEKGLQIHPLYDTGTLVLAKSYYLSGNKIKAREVLQNFLASNPASLAGHKLLGDICLEEDDVVGTVSHYRIALRFDPINRQIIQTLVDLKDKYQKIKESKSGDEEEESEVKPVIKKVPPKPVVPEKPAEMISPAVKEQAVPKAPADQKAKLDSFIEEAIQPEEVKFVFNEPEKQLEKKIEPIVAKVEEKSQPTKETGEFTPAYTDESGIMYFYDDDEVSFDQYKKRLELQKAGKAFILERALLDQKLIEKGVKSSLKEAPKEEDVFKQTEAAFEPVMSYKEAGFESEFPPEEKPGKEEKKFTSFEEHVDESMAREEEELLSAAEQEAALSELEVSYKDYLDILTNENDLLEALFQEEATPAEEIEDKAAAILKTAMMKETSAIQEELPGDQPMAYLDYMQSLENESEIAEANLAAPVQKDDGELLSFTDYTAYLDQSEELIDFNAYSMLLMGEGASPETLWKKEKKTASQEPKLKYDEYLASISEAERSEAVFEAKAPEVIEEKPAIKTAPKPVAEELIAEIKTDEPPIPKVEPFEQKPELKAVEPPQAQQEEIAEAEEEVEELAEDEINPQDATPEMVEKLAARGQFGTAYKVCKMLKVKNPTDAKVDRKILELKRLYVWSSQMVG